MNYLTYLNSPFNIEFIDLADISKDLIKAISILIKFKPSFIKLVDDGKKLRLKIKELDTKMYALDKKFKDYKYICKYDNLRILL